MSDTTLEGQTILITGGAGFIGSHIADAVVDHNYVRVLDDLSTGSRTNVPTDADLIEADVRDREALETAMDGVDVVFHEVVTGLE